jgi:hypothetical protein
MPSNLDQWSNNSTGPFKDNPTGAIGADDMRAFAAAISGDIDVVDSAKQSKSGINVKDYGAVGNGVADDTAAIQAAVDAANASKKAIFFPACDAGQFYKLTAVVTITKRGQVIVGENPWQTIIKQTTANQHAFSITDDTSGDTSKGTNSNGSIRFENLRLLGVGAGTSTGYGVNANSDGDWLQFINCTVSGFLRGVHVNGWAQVAFDTCIFDGNGYGIYCDSTDSQVNTISLRNTGVGTSTTAGLYLGGGGGMTIVGGDWVSQPLHINVYGVTSATAQLTIIGGNFESVNGAGTEFIRVSNNSRLTCIGTQFQKTSGNDVPPVQVFDSASVQMINPHLGGLASTTPIVKKTDNSQVVSVLIPSGSLSNSFFSVADPSTSVAHAPFTSRQDNAVPSADIRYRGLPLAKFVRDSISDEDALYYYMRDRRSGSDVYTRRTLTSVITGTGSPESVVTAGVGTMYSRTDGGAGTSFYVKETGTGNTGWVAK